MATFSPQVERWRSTVRDAVRDLRSVAPASFDVLGELRITDALFEDIALAIIHRESAGESGALGDAGCSVGLMQINYCANGSDAEFMRYALRVGGQVVYRQVRSSLELYNARANVGVGVRYFLACLNRFRSVEAALIGYNGYNQAVRWTSPPYPTPTNFSYLEGVLSVLGVTVGYFENLAKGAAGGRILFPLVLVGVVVVLIAGRRTRRLSLSI